MKLPKQSQPIIRDKRMAGRCTKHSGVNAQEKNCQVICSGGKGNKEFCMNICENT
jgi:hypothetical protein